MKREVMEIAGGRATRRSRSPRAANRSRSASTRARARARTKTGGRAKSKIKSISARGRSAARRGQRATGRATAVSRQRRTSAGNSTTDLNVIRRWAEQRQGKPVSVKGTARGGAAGLLRIDFPGYSGAGRLQEISWEQWYRKFKESNLEFLYQDRASNGQPSRFFKLVSRGGTQRKRARSKSSAR
jgi:hypothetical protein